MELNDRALLVQLSISQWTGRKFDKKVTNEVAYQHGVNAAVGRYHKALLPATDKLKQVHQKSTFIRTEFYRNTLPWGLEGTMILPTANYLNFMSEFRKHKSDWNALVEEFIKHYEDIKNDAQQVLGSLYNEDDYPSVDQMQYKFRMDLAVFPIPANDFRVDISSDELTRIQQDVEARVQSAAQSAMQDVWQRLFDRVKHIADKLNDPSAIFRDSMLENARDLCELLPRLNLTDDPNLEALRSEVEQKLVRNNPDSLRADPALRRDKAAEANDMLARMSVFMGGIQ